MAHPASPATTASVTSASITPAAAPHRRRWLVGLTLLVLALHAVGLTWWWASTPKPPITAATASPPALTAPTTVSLQVSPSVETPRPPESTPAHAETHADTRANAETAAAVTTVAPIPPRPVPAEPPTGTAQVTQTTPATDHLKQKQPVPHVNQALLATVKNTPKPLPSTAPEFPHAPNTAATAASPIATPTATDGRTPAAAAPTKPPRPTNAPAPPTTAPLTTPLTTPLTAQLTAPSTAPTAPVASSVPATAGGPSPTSALTAMSAATVIAAGAETNTTTELARQVTVARRVQVPASMALQFDVQASRKGLSLPARSTLTWQAEGDRYSARWLIQAPLVRDRSQTSVGQIDPVLGLQPLRFGDKNRSEVAAHFDHQATPPAIRFSSNNPDAPLLASSQDRLSVLFQLAAMFAGEPRRYAPGQVVTLHTAGSHDAELWHFTVGATDNLDLPVGAMSAIHLTREAQGAYDNRVELWLAPGLGHLPVRMRWTQANGDVVDQQLSSHSP